MSRTDKHRESQFNPLDYTYQFSYAHGSGQEPGYNLGLLHACISGKPAAEPVFGRGLFGPVITGHREVKPIDGLSGRFFSESTDQCDVCGALYRYGDVWQHTKTGEVITIGHECADKYGRMVDRRDLERYRKEQARVRKLGRQRAKRIKGMREFVRKSSPELRKALKSDHRIIKDIRFRLIKYGNISEAQKDLVMKLATEFCEKKNDPEEPRTVPAQINGGRQTIAGEVISCKWRENDYGGSYKITVKIETDAGYWIAWGTCPNTIIDSMHSAADLKGCKIRFDARLEQGREAHFAFFRRPTKAEVLERLAPEYPQAEYEEMQRARRSLNDVEEGARKAYRVAKSEGRVLNSDEIEAVASMVSTHSKVAKAAYDKYDDARGVYEQKMAAYEGRELTEDEMHRQRKNSTTGRR